MARPSDATKMASSAAGPACLASVRYPKRSMPTPTMTQMSTPKSTATTYGIPARADAQNTAYAARA